MTQAPAISVRDVDKVFRPAPGWLRILVRNPISSEIQALKSVSLEIAPGEVCALVGPNGAGKTTLFRILVGLTTPSSGHAEVLGRDVVSQSLEVRRLVGWMPTSSRTLFQRHTVAENLRFHGRVHGMSGRTLDKRVEETLDLVDLNRAKNNAVLSLSAGMTARVQLARALLHKPRLLILDEPTSSVDPVASLELIDSILAIVRDRNIAAFVSSHRLDEIEALHSHVLLLHRGRVMFDGDLDDLRRQLDAPTFRIEFENTTSMNGAVSDIQTHSSVLDASIEGRAIVMSLKPTAALGPVLASMGSLAEKVTAVNGVDRPLRDVLAEVYGAADSAADDQRD